jgi:hypothetical protein
MAQGEPGSGADGVKNFNISSETGGLAKVRRLFFVEKNSIKNSGNFGIGVLYCALCKNGKEVYL